MLSAMVEGYQERLFDQECLAVHQGFWAAYYQAKHPKSVKSVLTEMIRKHAQSRRKSKPAQLIEVNLEQVYAREARLNKVRK